MHLIPFKGFNNTGSFNLNLLYKQGKTYIMDNHLAASWCWAQELNLNAPANLFHIDRHHDLATGQLDWWIERLNELGVDLLTIDILDLIAIKFRRKDYSGNEMFQLLRWDNYITIFHRLYPDVLREFWFVTHKDDETFDEIEMYTFEPYSLLQNLSYQVNEHPQVQWIVNLDLDYFFLQNGNGTWFQFLSDEFIRKVALEIREAWDNITVFTIALTPEFCGGWENALMICNRIISFIGLQQLNLNIR